MIAKQLFIQNPDSLEGFRYLQTLDPQKWAYRCDTDIRLSALDLSNRIYSQIEPRVYPSSLDKRSSSRVHFPQNDRVLEEFLWHSLSKQDILKPYSDSNLRHSHGIEHYTIENATVISTPISIAVLDSEGKIIKRCSHNAPETLLAWYRYNGLHQNLHEIDKAILINTQQSFNLGHWFIDSLSRLYAVVHKVDLRELSIIIDSNPNSLSRDSLGYFSPKSVITTLPTSVIRARFLHVPVVSSFEERCIHANRFVKEFIAGKQVVSQDIIDLVQCGKKSKIYLSRQQVARRKFLNGPEVESILKSYDYIAICPELYSFSDIAFLMHHSSSIIGGNGAALCNILAARECSLGLGIIYPHTHLDDYYFRVSQSLGHNFAGTLAQSQHYHSLEESIRCYYYPKVGSDYYVDLSRLRDLAEAVDALAHS